MDKFFFSNLFGDFRNQRWQSDDDDYSDSVNDHNSDNPANYEQNLFDSVFSNPFQDFHNEAFDMFHNMETMFQQLFSSSFGSTGLENWDEKFPTEDNPRNYMLKNPEENSHPLKIAPPIFESPLNQDSYKDTDIDDKVAADGLFHEKNFHPFKWEEPSSSTYKFKKIVSIKTVLLPDGTLKEQQTCTDSNGKKITKISRSIGDQTHEIITQSDQTGLKEKEENFFNLDESSLLDFEKRWQNLKNGQQQVPLIFSKREQADLPDVSQKPLVPAGDSKYLSLFKKFFSIPT